MSDGRAERLARQIRSACGRYNDDDEPVVLCVAQMRERISELEAKLAAAEADAGQVTGETSGGNCDHVTRRRLGKMCQCLDYCERKDPYSKNPAGVCRGQPTRKGVGSE